MIQCRYSAFVELIKAGNSMEVTRAENQRSDREGLGGRADSQPENPLT
mgnify:CR=1 FL=1